MLSSVLELLPNFTSTYLASMNPPNILFFFLAVAYEHHMTIKHQVIRTETSLQCNFFKKKM